MKRVGMLMVCLSLCGALGCESNASNPTQDSGFDSGAFDAGADAKRTDTSIADASIDIGNGETDPPDTSLADGGQRDGGLSDARNSVEGTWIANPETEICYSNPNARRRDMYPLVTDDVNEDDHLVAARLAPVSVRTRFDRVEYFLKESAVSDCATDFAHEVLLFKATDGQLSSRPMSDGSLLRAIPVAAQSGVPDGSTVTIGLDLETPVEIAAGESLVIAVRWQNEIRDVDEVGGENTMVSMCLLNCAENQPSATGWSFASRAAQEPYNWGDNVEVFQIGGNMLARAHLVN